MAADLRARREPCCLCGQPIDYTLPRNDRWSFTVAHGYSVKTHPALARDPDNIRGAAHRACNSSAGISNEPLGLGGLSADW
jgi:hypothetical protein